MFSATDAALEGFRLAGRRPLLMVFWAVAYSVAIIVLLFVMFAAIAPSLLPLMLKGPGALEHGLPHDSPFNPIGFAIAFPIFFIAVIVLSAMTITAVYRAILRPKERGFGYLRVGGDEGRQVLLMLLVLVVMSLTVGAAVAVVFAATTFTPEPWKALAGIGGGIVCALLIIWVATRLSLASAQTFAERRVTLFDSWRLTRGRFWPLLGMWLLSAVLAVVVSLLASVLSYIPMAFAGPEWMPFPFKPTAEMPSLNFNTTVIVALAANMVIQMVGAVLQIVVQTAPGAAAYARLKPAPAA